MDNIKCIENYYRLKKMFEKGFKGNPGYFAPKKQPYFNFFYFIFLYSLITIVLIQLFSSCTKHSQEVELALESSMQNRRELKNVLDYYKHDKLKYTAACFLIENMKWHYGKHVKPSESLWDLFVLEDSLIRPFLREPGYYKHEHALFGYKYGAKKVLIDKVLQNSIIKNEIQTDLLALDASFIIENIDAAFQVKKLDWCNHLTFEEFCEFVLPYRMNNEPIYPLREKLKGHLMKLYETDTLRDKGWTSISFLNNIVNHFNWDWDSLSNNPSIGFYDIFFWNQLNFTCSEHVAILGQMMRSIGLPVAEVFTPKWRNYNLGHSWCSIPISGDSLAIFSSIYQNPGDVYLPHCPSMATKLYMKTYASQPESPFFLKAEGEICPIVFESPCIIDVTSNFVPVRDVEIKLLNKFLNNNLYWFSVFIQGNWSPVGWGIINKTKNAVFFKDIPIGLTGIVCFYDKWKLIPCSKLFTITDDGIRIIQPENSTSTLFLTRKFPVKMRMQYFFKDIIGTKVQGANNHNFSDSVTLYTITDTLQPYLQDITFNNIEQFRYYRLYAPTWELNIAEVEFLTEHQSHRTVEATPLPVFRKDELRQKIFFKLTGNVIGPEPNSQVFDGDMLTYSREKWAGIDLGKPQNINRIRIAPRNAHNGIVPGDHYELLYWDDEWVSFCSKQAEYNYVEFDNVPENTLYWLRNLDIGKEEQPFFYVNGNQIFSNQ